MTNSVESARSAGHKLVSNGFSQPRRGTVRPAHIRVEWNTTICGKTLSEPNRINDTEYLGQYKLCTACSRKAN